MFIKNCISSSDVSPSLLISDIDSEHMPIPKSFIISPRRSRSITLSSPELSISPKAQLKHASVGDAKKECHPVNGLLSVRPE